MFTEKGFELISGFIERQISAAAYVMNGLEVKTEFETERVQEDMFLIKFFLFPEKSGEITEIRLYDKDENLWYQKQENIEMRRADGKFYYVCKIKVDEVIENE